MAAARQPSLLRRAATMWLLTAIELMDAISKLFMFSLVVIISAGLLGGAVPMILCMMAIFGWAADIGGARAREIFEQGLPATAERVSARSFLAIALYGALTIALAAGLGSIVITIHPAAGVLVAIATPPAADRLHTWKWYLNPAAIVVELLSQLVAGESLLPRDGGLSELTTSDLRTAVARQP